MAVMAAWRAWAHTQVRRMAALVDCLERHGHEVVSDAFRTWHANVVQIADERAMLHMCCSHIQGVRLRASVHAWKGWLHRRALRHELVALACQRQRKRMQVSYLKG